MKLTMVNHPKKMSKIGNSLAYLWCQNYMDIIDLVMKIKQEKQ